MIVPGPTPIAPPTPGEVLRDLLQEGGITQDQLASAMGVSRFSINQLVNARRTVTTDMALRLAKAMSTSPEFWLNLQRSMELYEARQRLAQELEAIQVVRELPSEEALFYDPA